MKKILLLVSFLCIIGFYTINVSAETYGDLTYKITDNEIAITDCSSSAIDVEIPSYINNYPVKRIEFAAFRNCVNLTHVTIPEASASTKGFKSEEYVEARIEAVKSGKVVSQELIADRYMAKNLTNEELINFISFWRKYVKHFHDNIDKFKKVLSKDELVLHELNYNELEIRMNIIEQFV